jgi:hypothetical protein
MLKIIALSMSVIAASAATAQAPYPSSTAPTDPSAPSSAPVTAAPAPAGAPAQSPSPAAPAGDPSTAAATSSSPVASLVESGFPKYDKDGSGTLSAAEFKQWISDLKAQEMTAEGKAADPAAAKQYAGTALKAADKNKDGKVTKDELTAFLSG